MIKHTDYDRYNAHPDHVVGDWAIAPLWAFWAALIVRAVLGAVAYRAFGESDT